MLKRLGTFIAAVVLTLSLSQKAKAKDNIVDAGYHDDKKTYSVNFGNYDKDWLASPYVRGEFGKNFWNTFGDVRFKLLNKNLELKPAFSYMSETDSNEQQKTHAIDNGSEQTSETESIDTKGYGGGLEAKVNVGRFSFSAEGYYDEIKTQDITDSITTQHQQFIDLTVPYDYTVDVKTTTAIDVLTKSQNLASLVQLEYDLNAAWFKKIGVFGGYLQNKTTIDGTVNTLTKVDIEGTVAGNPIDEHTIDKSTSQIKDESGYKQSTFGGGLELSLGAARAIANVWGDNKKNVDCNAYVIFRSDNQIFTIDAEYFNKKNKILAEALMPLLDVELDKLVGMKREIDKIYKSVLPDDVKEAKVTQIKKRIDDLIAQRADPGILKIVFGGEAGNLVGGLGYLYRSWRGGFLIREKSLELNFGYKGHELRGTVPCEKNQKFKVGYAITF